MNPQITNRALERARRALTILRDDGLEPLSIGVSGMARACSTDSIERVLTWLTQYGDIRVILSNGHDWIRLILENGGDVLSDLSQLPDAYLESAHYYDEEPSDGG